MGTRRKEGQKPGYRVIEASYKKNNGNRNQKAMGMENIVKKMWAH